MFRLSTFVSGEREVVSYMIIDIVFVFSFGILHVREHHLQISLSLRSLSVVYRILRYHVCSVCGMVFQFSHVVHKSTQATTARRGRKGQSGFT